MNKLISLVNVFALLSILAVGGGTAVLPQMKHETVATHQWLSAEQFTDIYSLGAAVAGAQHEHGDRDRLLRVGDPGGDPGASRLLSAVVYTDIRGREVLGPL